MEKCSGNGLLVFIRFTFTIILVFKLDSCIIFNNNRKIIKKKFLWRVILVVTHSCVPSIFAAGDLLYRLTPVGSPETHVLIRISVCLMIVNVELGRRLSVNKTVVDQRLIYRSGRFTLGKGLFSSSCEWLQSP